MLKYASKMFPPYAVIYQKTNDTHITSPRLRVKAWKNGQTDKPNA